jgi:iron complex outermembrane recepter protein
LKSVRFEKLAPRSGAGSDKPSVVSGRLGVTTDATLAAFPAAVLLATCAFYSPAFADDSNPETVIVTGQAHDSAQTIDAGDLAALHAMTVPEALNETIPSAFVSDTEANPFQLDIYYRGFDASPVLGTPEGLAVYQNGNRINEPFGDTVLWDLVPAFALKGIDVVPGSDPILGLNALGGAVALDMKTGFDLTGEHFDVSGGSYDRATGISEIGEQYGDTAVYVGASLEHDGSWRLYSESNVGQAYIDVTTREAHWNLGTSLTIALDHLSDNAAVPVQDNLTAAFAIPDTVDDRVIYLQEHGEYDWDSQTTLRGAWYVRSTRIDTQNGEASGFGPCPTDPTLLCSDDDPPEVLTDQQGAPIPSSVGGTATNGLQTTVTNGFGATLEAQFTGAIANLPNTAIVGTVFDDAISRFTSRTALGNLTFQQGGVTAVDDGILLGGDEWNIGLDTVNTDAGLYGEDTLSLTSNLSVRVSGRFNLDRIALTDQLGTALTGSHDYSGFNPAARLTWRLTSDAEVYADFGQSSRTPTAAELSCANPLQPCLFPLSFISDPGLRQVVARTVELGARGNTEVGSVAVDWLGDVYETRNSNDILFVSTGFPTTAGYFANVGETERQGAEASIHGVWGNFDARATYGLVLATFQTAFSIQSPFNPGADPNGNIFVKPGDFLPNIPRHLAKLDVGYQVTQALHLGLQARATSSVYLRGDEANLQHPLDGYVVFDASADYRIAEGYTLYVTGENIFDNRYATFGLYGDPTGGGAFPQFTSPRFIVPAAPVEFQLGLKVAL